VARCEEDEGEMPVLDGEIAIVCGTDLIAPARGIYTFYNTHKDNLSIVGGIFERAILNAAEMMSSRPSHHSRRSMVKFVNLIIHQFQRFAVVVNEIAKVRN